MTTPLTGGPTAPDRSRGRRVLTVPRLVHAEWTKARTVRSLPAVLLLTAAVVVLPGLAVAAATVVQLGTLSPQARASFDPSAAALSGVSLATLAAAVLGALVIGGEYATGAVRTLLVTAPRRWDVLLAKAVVLVLSVAPVAAAATAVTFVGAQRVLGTRDLDTPVTAGLATTAAGAALALTSAALLGLAVATVVRSTTTATVVLVAVLLVLPTLAGLVPGSTGRQVQRVLPSTALDRLSSLAPASLAPASLAPASLDRSTLEAAVRRWAVLHATEAATGGITVAVVGPDGRTSVAAAGADPAGVPLQPDALLRMGSITKTYVAVALLRAQARGLVDLERPVTAYLEDVPGAPGVTVRQLLQMRSGIPDHVDGDAWVEAVTAAPARSWRLREVLSLVPDDIRRPGSFEYSNTNYLLAGLVLERATGTDWRTAVEQLVLDPLDLGRTHTGSEGRSVVPGTLEDGRGARIRTDEQPYTAVETTAASSGALLSTAEDLARFGHALLDRSQVPADQWRELTAFSGPPDSYGLSLADLGAQSRRTGSGGPFALGNAGEIPGYGATLLLYPEAGAAVAVMRNDDRIDALPLAASFAADLGLDRDPDELTGRQAALLALACVGVVGGCATAVFRRRNA